MRREGEERKERNDKTRQHTPDKTAPTPEVLAVGSQCSVLSRVWEWMRIHALVACLVQNSLAATLPPLLFCLVMGEVLG
eukprot:7556241-Prorocentrum_lima.AAC.1